MHMESSTVGLGDEYDISDVPHAQRLTTSGTFVHGNYGWNLTWADWEAGSRFSTYTPVHGMNFPAPKGLSLL
ncbi:hypothetical protein [Streptomyces sp. SD31]|uniref:hypothetical protein n=1 Tax=Streptomyces sp. SD31 TaxID=3452208 RepID=UPI003F8C8A9C